jgi:phenylalanyl-tRNA synthetase alpha chain
MGKRQNKTDDHAPSEPTTLPEELVREVDEARQKALADVVAAQDEKALEQARVAHLGLKGAVTRLFERIPKIPPEQRRGFGQKANSAKGEIEKALAEQAASLKQKNLERELSGERLDVTLPGRRGQLGRRHLVSRTADEVSDIFGHLGFDIATGPEIEIDYFNFEALNMPPNHPARDMQATFYVDPKSMGRTGVLLRTQTSPVQIHTMLAQRPPVRIIAPGRCYRCDYDVTHTPMFHQIEGLLVDRGVSFAMLKGTLDAFAKAFFGSNVRTRFRPSFFPFTEPSAEVDVSCMLCNGKGCRVCKMTGWLEVLGSGMVHPNVFKAVGYDPNEITGFAFGMGVERLAFLRYGLDDLRALFENDARFLEQF